MKRILTLWFIVFFLLVIQSAFSTWAPVCWLPDTGILVVFALAFAVPREQGAWMVTALGYTEDVLSGSLMGQYALIYLVLFEITAQLARHLNLRSPLHRGVIVFLGIFGKEYILLLLGRFFGWTPFAEWIWSRELLIHAGVNGFLSILLLNHVIDRMGFSEEEALQQELQGV